MIVRFSGRARADLRGILATSLERWGEVGRRRYEALVQAAIQHIAADPKGPLTSTPAGIGPRYRVFHLRAVRAGRNVHAPVHYVLYRVSKEAIVIVRVLHERMDSSLIR
jgi:toxin ParE1/3/4